MTAALATLLGTERPIVQAPMAGVQGSALALAVSNAGGLGSLPCAMLDRDALRREVAALREGTSKPWALGFFAHRAPVPDPAREAAWRAALAPYYAEYGIDPATVPAGAGRVPFGEEQAELLDAVRPPVVSFHFGLPPEALLARVKGWGSTILATATTVHEARWLVERGVDAVVAQGLEAGGHRGMFLSEDLSGQLGTFALVPQVARAIDRPVIAAGGIADARGVAAALALGAAGVQVGTAYLLCPECTTTPVHRAALTSEAAGHTAVTRLFTGRPARAIVNRVMRELGPMSEAPPAFPLAPAALAPLRARAEAAARGDFSPLWAGQNAIACREIPAARLTRELSDGLFPTFFPFQDRRR